MSSAWLLAALLAGGGSAACGGPSLPAAPVVQQPPAWAGKHLSAVVVAPEGAQDGLTKQTWSTVKSRLEAALIKNGFEIVTAGTPRALLFRLEGQLSHDVDGPFGGCASSFSPWGGSVDARIQAGERTIDILTGWHFDGRCGNPEIIAAQVVPRIVSALRASTPMASFAEALGPKEPGAPAATPAAAPAPAPATLAAPARASATPQRTAYALVIGIERYRDIPPPPGARADADAFANMLRTTLGLPDANVRLAVDDRATGKDIERHLSWLKANVPPGGRVYFFFSGHGAPSAAKGASYLVPYDGDAQAIEETSILLDKVLAELGETKAKETMAFVDACFSGAGGRSILPKGARPLVKLKEVSGPKAVAVFAASSGSQISGPSQDGNNGAFTKYLLEAIGEAKADINGDGQLTLQELAEWVTPRVEREAKQQSRDQTPKLSVGGKVGNPKDVAVAWGLK